MSEFIPISDPATMAQPYAESLMLGGHIDTMTHTEQEEQALKELTQIAFDSKMLFAKYIFRRTFRIKYLFLARRSRVLIHWRKQH